MRYGFGTVSLLAALLLLPSAVLAESNRRGFASSRASSRRFSSAPHATRPIVSHIAPAPRAAVATVAPTPRGSAVTPVSVNPAAVTPAGVTAVGVNSRFAPQRGRSGWSQGGFDNLGLKRTRAFGVRRADEPQTPAPAPAENPPYNYTPGALIRTEGLGYKATPTDDARWQNNDPGYAITQDPGNTVVLNPFAGIHVGPPDRQPAANAGGASGRNAITPNPVGFADSGGSADSSGHNRDQGGKPDDPGGHGQGGAK
ncbi:MAG: hypothetical protein PHU21_13455 [Elusimicrobia bacterium]|nr:hypothetical protein [Elusimicrobiota bacterium]